MKQIFYLGLKFSPTNAKRNMGWFMQLSLVRERSETALHYISRWPISKKPEGRAFTVILWSPLV